MNLPASHRHELDEISGDLSDFKPRELQRAIRECNARHQVAACHRRIGKTVGAADWIIQKINECERPFPRGYFVFPFATQAEEVVWDVLLQLLKHYEIAYTPTKGRLRVDLKHNGGRIQLVGAERYYKHRGKYADAVVFDEVPFIPPDCWESVFRPMLADRAGESLFLFTANGRDWAHALYEKAATLPDWARHKITVYESGILSPEEIAALERETAPHKFAREFLCDFEQAAPGAYFERRMNELTAADHVGMRGLFQLELPVFTTWNMDDTDSIALAVWQREGPLLNCLYAKRELQCDLEDAVAHLQEEARRREWSFERHYCTGKLKASSDRMRIMRRNGLDRVMIGKEREQPEAVAVCRSELPSFRFGEEASLLVDGMRHYHAKYFEASDTFGGPVDDWASQWAQLGIGAALNNGRHRSDWTTPIPYRSREERASAA